METKDQNPAARMATIDQLLETTIPNFLSPAPSRRTLRNWLEAANVPKFKSNPAATRGGGIVWYSVAAVEKLLRSKTIGSQRMIAA